MGLGSFIIVAFVLGLVFLALAAFGVVWKLMKWGLKAAIAVFLIWGAVVLISVP